MVQRIMSSPQLFQRNAFVPQMAYPVQGLPQQKVWKKYVLIACVILIAVISSYFLFFSRLEVTIKVRPLPTQELVAGELLVFEKTVISSKKKTPVDIVYEIYDLAGKRIVQKKESLLISGESKTQSRMVMPLTIDSGQYTLRASIAFEGGSGSDAFSFRVGGNAKPSTPENVTPPTITHAQVAQQVPAVPQTCAAPCTSIDRCLKGSCVGGSCSFEAIIPCCGNGKCEINEDSSKCSSDCAAKPASSEGVIESAKSIVRKDSPKAIVLCNSLIEDAVVDECMDAIATTVNNSVVCASMHVGDSRDACYMNFALAGDFSVCDKIMDRYRASSCAYITESQGVVQQQK